MNFPRFNKMKGMGQIISWSVRDETLHCLSIIRLFRTFVQENPEIWTERAAAGIYLICATIVEHEDSFIDLAFELGGVEGLMPADASSTSASSPIAGCSSWVSTRTTTSRRTRCPGSTRC